ncbi:MAG: nucleotidyltransferase family protein [Pseudomonadota bacterium]|nr:nucleotidyltransferase family protein [Pseudomonadota bacterium]
MAAGDPGTGVTAKRIVGVLLAAGRAKRFGSDKLLAALPRATAHAQAGTGVAVASCIAMRAALPETIVIVRPECTELAHALQGAGARVVECSTADSGMSATLACAIAATPDAEGWVIGLADMPWIAAVTVARVAGALDDGALLAAPFLATVRGHPVGFCNDLRAELLALRGDHGAREIIRAHGQRMVRVPVGDAGILRDVDTPADLAD